MVCVRSAAVDDVEAAGAIVDLPRLSLVCCSCEIWAFEWSMACGRRADVVDDVSAAAVATVNLPRLSLAGCNVAPVTELISDDFCGGG